MLLVSLNAFPQATGTPYLPLAPKYRLGGASTETPVSIKKTADGGYVLLSYGYSNMDGDVSETRKGIIDYWVVKLDAAGQKIWDRRYGGIPPASNQPQRIQQTTDGGYIVFGYSNASATGDVSGVNNGLNDLWIVKLDSFGNKQWDKIYGGDDNEFGYYIIQTADGGYMAVGSTASSASGNVTEPNKGGGDIWVIKLNSVGNLQWDKRLGGNSTDSSRYVQQTSDGGYFIAGATWSGVSGDVSQPAVGASDFWAIKLNAAGNKQWDRRFGGSLNEGLSSAQITPDGGYILAGTSTSSNNGDVSGTNRGNSDYWIVKIDASGNKLWDKLYGGTGNDIPYAIKNTPDGGYILAGESNSSASFDVTGTNNGGIDYWILKLDSFGNKQWDKLYGGIGDDSARDIELTASGGYLVTGRSAHESAKTGNQIDLTSRGGQDAWNLFLDANGNIIQP